MRVIPYLSSQRLLFTKKKTKDKQDHKNLNSLKMFTLPGKIL